MVEKLTQKLIDFEELKLPATVYKYRNWEDKYHKTMITDLQAYMSPATDFEDTMDCKNQVRWDLLTDEEIHSKYYHESVKDNPHFSESEHKKFADAWLKNTPVRDKKFIDTHQAQDFLNFNEQTGILCLTANPVRPEMWNKYSNGHTGFSVGFDPKIMFKQFSGGMEVFYPETLPIIKPTPWDDFMVQTIKQVYHKEKKWEFEEEYRAIKLSMTPLTKEGRVITLPVEAYKEIIFGAKLSEKNKAEITSIAKKLIPHIKFKQAVIIGDKVKIEE